MTHLINLFAGPGCGKSTLAAEMFSYLKHQDKEAELITEYVKMWAWKGIHPKFNDTYYIFGKQLKRESDLYGKVDYIITDAPLELSSIYENKYNNLDLLRPLIIGLRNANKSKLQITNFFLPRKKDYHPKGRYQSLSEAIEIDERIKEFLTTNKIPYHTLQSSGRPRVYEINNIILKEILHES